MNRRTVFFVSDQTGVTAETMGQSLLMQFRGVDFHAVTLPFVSTVERARQAVQRIDATAQADGVRPIVFATLVEDELRSAVRGCQGVFLDFFDAFLDPLEAELGVESAHTSGREHRIADVAAYTMRINATNYALASDDGAGVAHYQNADVLLVGVSRTGKTPTSLYMALQYGVFVANYPLTEEDLDSNRLPPALVQYRNKLYGLTIDPQRLQQIRQERLPNSRYASPRQVQFEVRAAEALFSRQHILHIDVTECSIEEISSRILDQLGIERRVRP